MLTATCRVLEYALGRVAVWGNLNDTNNTTQGWVISEESVLGASSCVQRTEGSHHQQLNSVTPWMEISAGLNVEIVQDIKTIA